MLTRVPEEETSDLWVNDGNLPDFKIEEWACAAATKHLRNL